MARMWELAPSNAGWCFYLAQRGEQAIPLLWNAPDTVEIPSQPAGAFNSDEFDKLKARFGNFASQFVGKVKKTHR